MADDLRGVSDEELRDAMTPIPFRRPKQSKSYRLHGAGLATPAIVERFTQRAHRFKCPACYRVYVGVYKPEKPIPVCMGGGRAGLHPRWMLVSEIWDEYEHMRVRFERGDATTRPLIQPQNASKFEVQAPGDAIRDLGHPRSSPRG